MSTATRTTRNAKSSKTDAKTDNTVTTPVPVATPAPVTTHAPVSTPAPVVAKTNKNNVKNQSLPVVESSPPVVESSPPVAESSTTDNLQETDAKRRNFECVYVVDGNVVRIGKYRGKKPKQAGSKACTRLFKTILSAVAGNKRDKMSPMWVKIYESFLNKSVPDNIMFGIHECSHNRPNRVFVYTGSRVKLNEPETVKIDKKDKDGKQIVITYLFNNKVNKCRDTQSDDYKLLSNYEYRHERTERTQKETVSEETDSSPRKRGTKKEPVVSQPAVSQPVVSQPAVSQPTVPQPAVSTSSKSTKKKVVEPVLPEVKPVLPEVKPVLPEVKPVSPVSPEVKPVLPVSSSSTTKSKTKKPTV